MDKISAFVDGESAPADTLAVLKRLRSDEDSRKNIDTFHMIGDVMRGDPVLRGDFVERLRARLDEEPTVLAPHARWRRSAPALYAAAASIAGFAVIVGLAWTDNPLGQFAQGRGSPPQLAGFILRPWPMLARLTNIWSHTRSSRHVLRCRVWFPMFALSPNRTMATGASTGFICAS
jgi:hypothetical protein